ncbi:MAG: hypothetical protein AAFR96_11055 [Planctomycetota bacterium]
MNASARPSRAVWLFSLTRSGSSAAVYASAHALGWAVADEPFGPWDRTGDPYNYPPIQTRLHREHLARSEILCHATSNMLDELIASLADRARAPGVIIKMPHLMVKPDDLSRLRPDDRAAYLIRNPLARLNSLYTRGWHDTIYPPFDAETVKVFLHRASEAPRPMRLAFDALHATPRRFFRSLWRAWGIPFDESQVESAVQYRAQNYHESSADRGPGRNPHRVLSDHRLDVPPDAVDHYLCDPVIRAALEQAGWSLDPADYSSSTPR